MKTGMGFNALMEKLGSFMGEKKGNQLKSASQIFIKASN